MKKKITFLAFFIAAINFSIAQNPVYDQALADSLKADQYGMKMYMMVILKQGSKTADKEQAALLFKGHMENINRLADQHKLVIAGPFGENDKSYMGIFIFDAQTAEEAKLLLAGDPAVSYGLMDAEIYPWYGSAALPVYFETHRKIQKVKM